MADDTEEVFDFSNPEFTREDLVTALNEMVLEYKKLSQSFKEFKAEEESCATSAGIAGSSAMQAALSKLENKNVELRSRPEEMLHENQRLADTISSWTKSSASLQKLQGATKHSGDKTGLGYYSSEYRKNQQQSSARAKRCRINLCKRHRFAIAISKYYLLVNSSLRLDFLLYDVASLLRLDVQATCWFLATVGLKPSVDYDDVTDDVINAKPSADYLARRRFISFTSLLIC
ncbi:RNA-dependent RNA polymerase 6-like [Dorcoceras hygrometricum]|uniref:RNA-dependent RNA polymerase 6-like n=1 Tax=Dorcoceras hygrometricum TaxID=472368 RepID=A0A2Z7A5Y0_9LAMI|nr:RNA-dependent RNA polymerase 6-like [Dorcoceras hygrometricum]